EARCRPCRVDARVTGDGPAGLAGDAGDLLQVHRVMLAGIGTRGTYRAVLVFDRILRQFPQLGGAPARLLHHFPRGLHGGHAAREGGAAATGEEFVAELASVANLYADFVEWTLEPLSRHHAQRGPQTADVGRAGGERQRAVLVEGERHRRLAADVEPEAR